MSKVNLQDFCRMILNDLEIQDRLKNVTDRDKFILKVVELGEKSGFEFTSEDVEEQMRENRRQWHEKWM